MSPCFFALDIAMAKSVAADRPLSRRAEIAVL
jgi:hypothetical protein